MDKSIGRLTESRKSVQSLEAEKEHLHGQITTLQESLAKQNDTLQEAVKSLKVKKESMKAEKEHLHGQVANLQKLLAKQNDTSQETIKSLKAEKQSLTEQLSTSQKSEQTQ